MSSRSFKSSLTDIEARLGLGICLSPGEINIAVYSKGRKLMMSRYWLCYRHNNQISVVIEPGASLIHARLRAALAGSDEGTFTEGHELDRRWQVPKAMIGRRLSQEEAKRLLAKFELV
jgi:hypothetical protein